jgi:glycosyltransferase involved in cell wall biosynthesis
MMLLLYLNAQHTSLVLLPEDGPLRRWLDDQQIRSFIVPQKRLSYLKRCLEIVRREKVDLIYGNNPSHYSRNAMLAAQLARKPFIWHFRGVKWHWGWRKGLFLRLATRVIAVSQATADSLARFYPQQRMTVVHNGVELSEYSCDRQRGRQYVMQQVALPRGAQLLISVSHVNPRKGHEEALHVVHHLLGQGLDVHLLVAGSLQRDPAYVQHIREQMQRLGLSERVHLLGLREDVPQLLPGADLFLHTALRDAHPRAVVEAMASGLPVAAFAAGGVAETVVDGETGFLRPVGDCRALAEAAQTLLCEPQRALAWGMQGRRRVQEQFTAAATAQRIGAIIDEVLVA